MSEINALELLHVEVYSSDPPQLADPQDAGQASRSECFCRTRLFNIFIEDTGRDVIRMVLR